MDEILYIQNLPLQNQNQLLQQFQNQLLQQNQNEDLQQILYEIFKEHPNNDRIKQFLSSLSNINTFISFNKETFLHILCLTGNLEMIEYFLENGGNVNIVSENNHNPLYYLFINRYIDFHNIFNIIKLLVKYGINLNIQSEIINVTPLISACLKNFPYEIIKFMIDNGADFNYKTSIYNPVELIVLRKEFDIEMLD